MSASSNVRAGRAYVEITADSSKLQANLSKAQLALRNFGKTAQSVGRELLTLSAVAATPFALATKNFAAFDDTMRLVQGVTGSTGKAFEDLTEKAQALGRETSFTAQQAAEAMVSLGRMGFSSQEIQDAIGSVLDLSRATGTELAQAADIAANSMRIFGINAAEMTRVADILSATANGSAQTLVDLFEGLKVAGPQAVAAGESIEQTAAALGVLANVGIKGSLAGTALRKSFSQFASTDVRAYLADFGVSTVDATGNLRSMADVMRDLAGVMSQLSSSDKIAFAEEVFDLRGSLAGLSITADPAALDAFLSKLEDVDGVAAKTAKTMDEGLGGSFRLLSSAVEGSMNAAGEAISETLMPVVARVTRVINSLTEWIKTNQSTVTTIATLAAAAGALGAALLVLGTVSSAASRGIGMLKIAFSGVEKVVTLASTKIKAFVATTQTAGVATAMLKTKAVLLRAALSALKALGFTAVLAGVGYALFALVKRAGEAQRALNGMKTAMADARAEGDRQRAADQDRMRRLEQLAQKERLNASEMAEAERHAAALNERYGDLGITISKTAQSVDLATDAHGRMNEQMREAQALQLDAEILEMEANIARLQNAREDLDSFGTKLGYVWSFDFSGAGEDYLALGKELEAATVSLRRLQMLKEDLEESDEPILEETVESFSAVAEAAETAENKERKSLEERKKLFEEAEKADERLAEIEKQIRRDSMSALEQELEDVRDLTQEYLDLKDAKIQAEYMRHDTSPQRIEAWQMQKEQMMATEAQRLADIQNKYAKEFAKAVAELKAPLEDAAENATSRELQRGIEALEKSNPAKATRLLERMLARVQAAFESATTEYKAAIEAATQDGSISDDERDALDTLRDRFSALAGKRENLIDQLARAKDATKTEAEKNTAKSVGSFYAAALRGLGISSIERQVKAAEKTADNTRRTVTLLESLADKELAFL